MKKTTGFTLAEILIVIGVIGVVAAITIPALINAISSKAQKAQTDVIEARLLDGLNRYNAMEDGLSKPYETTKEFLEGLSKYYKMNAICDSDEITRCVPYTKISYEVGEGEDKIIKSIQVANLTENSKLMSGDIAENYLPPASFITAQGTPVIIAFKKGCIWDSGKAMTSIKDSDCVSLMYDKNGTNLPNKLGDDIIGMGLTFGAPFKTINGIKVMEKAFLVVQAKGLMQDECLKEVDKQADYKKLGFEEGIKTCAHRDPWSTDNWAYAMKYCKDNGWHLPTTSESAKLVRGLYKNSAGEIPTGDSFSSKGFTPNTELENSIGIYPQSHNIFNFWISKESNQDSAYRRYVDINGMGLHTSYRGETSQYVICVGK